MRINRHPTLHWKLTSLQPLRRVPGETAGSLKQLSLCCYGVATSHGRRGLGRVGREGTGRLSAVPVMNVQSI